MGAGPITARTGPITTGSGLVTTGSGPITIDAGPITTGALPVATFDCPVALRVQADPSVARLVSMRGRSGTPRVELEPMEEGVEPVRDALVPSGIGLHTPAVVPNTSPVVLRTLAGLLGRARKVHRTALERPGPLRDQRRKPREDGVPLTVGVRTTRDAPGTTREPSQPVLLDRRTTGGRPEPNGGRKKPTGVGPEPLALDQEPRGEASVSSRIAPNTRRVALETIPARARTARVALVRREPRTARADP